MTSSNSTENFVWLESGFIGDIILITGAMELLHRKKPEIRQWVITTEVGAEILKGLGFLHPVITFSKKASLLKEIWRIRKFFHSHNLTPVNTKIIQAHRSFRSSIISRFTGCPVTTYKETAGSFFATITVERNYLFHETTRIALLLEPHGFEREEFSANLRPYLEEYKYPEGTKSSVSLPTNKPLICIAPGSTWGTKRWPLDSFVHLAKLILDHSDANLVLLGSPKEKALTDHMQKVLKAQKFGERVHNIAGMTSFDDLRFIFPKFKLVITNDSSPIHYASAFNIPTLAIFGATTSAMGFGPLADNSRVIEKTTLSCRPCGKHGPQTCPLEHFLCMKSISVDQVFNAFTEIYLHSI